MRKNQLFIVEIVLCVYLLVPGGVAQAETSLVGFIQRNDLASDIKPLGMMIIQTAHDRAVSRGKRNLRQNFWARKDKADLPEKELKRAREAFSKRVNSLARFMQKHPVKEVTVVGIDIVGHPKSREYYFASASNSGPILVSARTFYTDDGVNIKGLSFTDDWEKIKQAERRFDLGLRAGTDSSAFTISLSFDSGEKASEKSNDPPQTP